jgi:hypothetical protein
MPSELSLDRLVAKRAQEITKVVGKEYGRQDGRRVVRASEVDTFATKALGILQENGVYAAMLFLLSRSGNKLQRRGNEIPCTSDETVNAEQMSACHIIAELMNLLRDTGLFNDQFGKPMQPLPQRGSDMKWDQVNAQKDNILNLFVEHITATLDKLLLIKDLYEKSLIYVRFCAKAASEAEGGTR